MFRKLLNKRFLTSIPSKSPKNTTTITTTTLKPLILNENDLSETFIRGSGPGGQSVNKSKNRVRLTHIPTGIQVQCHQERDLETNRRIARRILRDKLDLLENGKESKLEKKYEKIRRRKSRATRRYGGKPSLDQNEKGEEKEIRSVNLEEVIDDNKPN